MKDDVLKRLKSVGLLSETQLDLGNIPTGSYALNKVISGNYGKGIPIGGITQFHGEASTAKTVFAAHFLREAQKLGHHTLLVDSENAINTEFVEGMGIDSSKLHYTNSTIIEECFDIIKTTIQEIREIDKDTPIAVAFDSLAVCESKEESEKGFESNPMTGAIRAKATGNCLRHMFHVLKEQKAALVLVNQLRSKIESNPFSGSPDTMASGGRALEYYLLVNLKCISNKSSDILRDDLKNAIGIQGKVRNTKNKVSTPYRQCEFELKFPPYGAGLNPEFGLTQMLVKDGVVTYKGGGYYEAGDVKFRAKELLEKVKAAEKDSPLYELREELGMV